MSPEPTTAGTPNAQKQNDPPICVDSPVLHKANAVMSVAGPVVVNNSYNSGGNNVICKCTVLRRPQRGTPKVHRLCRVFNLYNRTDNTTDVPLEDTEHDIERTLYNGLLFPFNLSPFTVVALHIRLPLRSRRPRSRGRRPPAQCSSASSNVPPSHEDYGNNTVTSGAISSRNLVLNIQPAMVTGGDNRGTQLLCACPS